MINNENDLINRINQKNQGGFGFFDKAGLSSLYEGLKDKTFGKKNNDSTNSNKPNIQISNKANAVIESDKILRQAVQNLAISLSELGDRDIAKNLIAEHIIMLNELFKEFE